MDLVGEVKHLLTVGRALDALELVKRHKDVSNGPVFEDLVERLHLCGKHDLVRRAYHMVIGSCTLPPVPPPMPGYRLISCHYPF
jgi:hypothetical protein